MIHNSPMKIASKVTMRRNVRRIGNIWCFRITREKICLRRVAKKNSRDVNLPRGRCEMSAICYWGQQRWSYTFVCTSIDHITCTRVIAFARTWKRTSRKIIRFSHLLHRTNQSRIEKHFTSVQRRHSHLWIIDHHEANSKIEQTSSSRAFPEVRNMTIDIWEISPPVVIWRVMINGDKYNGSALFLKIPQRDDRVQLDGILKRLLTGEGFGCEFVVSKNASQFECSSIFINLSSDINNKRSYR
jgi:hypothetical protein